jgi:uncharacterized membrane protein YdbT with pleckstrin-like domain
MDLHSGENILFEGHPSWRSILGFYIKGLFVALVAAGIAALVTKIADDEVNKGVVIAAGLAIFAVVVLVGFVKRIGTTYTITDQRLHIKRGIIARKIQQTQLERVQNVNTHQTALERILQVGAVDFDTAGTEDSDFTFHGVAQPEEVMAAVDKAQRGASAAPAAGGPAAGAGPADPAAGGPPTETQPL